jgi:hypothetical protein
LGICELCYHGATEEEIAACEMVVDPDGIEAQVLGELAQGNRRGDEERLTLVAFALARRDR